MTVVAVVGFLEDESFDFNYSKKVVLVPARDSAQIVSLAVALETGS